MKKLFSTFIIIIFTHFAFAQIARHHQIKEVLIEGEAQTNAIAKQKEDLAATIVISSKDINNFGHNTAGDVLKRMPRIFVQGPPTFNRNIMMAGLDKKFQSVLIDGNRPAGGEDYRDLKLDRIPTEMIEEIEITYNPPASLGADASIGVINIILKDAPEKRILTTNLSVENSSTHAGLNPDFNVSFGNNFGKLSFIGSYNYRNFERTNINYLQEGQLSGTEDEDIQVTVNGFTGTLNYKINENNNLKLKSFFSDYQEGLQFVSDIKHRSTGGLNTTADTADDVKIRRIHSHNLQYTKRGERWKWNTALNFAQHYDSKDRWRNQLKSSGLTETFEDEYQKNSESIINSDLSYKNDRHQIKMGVRCSGLWRNYSRIAYERISGRKFWDDIIDGSYELWEYRSGAYASDEISLNKLWILPAIRFDYDARNYSTTNDKGEFKYASINPSLHVKYAQSKSLFYKADIARQISRPPFNNQVPIDKIKHKKQTIERGNKNLKPSFAWNFGYGAEKYFENNSYIRYRSFYNVMRDVIENMDGGIDEKYGYRIIESVNVDSALVLGFDLDTRIMIVESTNSEISFAGNLSILGSRVRDASTGELRRLNEQPNWITNGSLDYINTKLKFQVSVGVNYVGERQIAGGTDEGTLVAPLIYNPYMQWDSRIKYFFKPWGNIYLNANNIFNETVDIQQGNVTESEIAGRNIRIGISLTF